MLALIPEAHAADMFWSNGRGDGSGGFSTAIHWSGGSPSNPPPPDADDIAHFGMTTGAAFPSTYTVTFTANATNEAVVVEDDSVTFDLNGRTYTTTAFLENKIGTVAGRTGSLTITDGTWDLGTGVKDHTLVGAVAGAPGTLIVSTGGRITGESDLQLGGGGPGTLTVQNGGSVNAFKIGVGSSAPGTLNITSNSSVHVDREGAGFAMRIGGGGVGVIGTANVDGANSTFTITGGLQVGSTGPGFLNISAGASVSSANGTVAPRGTVTITGVSSRWTNSANLDIGQSSFINSQNLLRLADGGQVQAATILISNGARVEGVGTLTGNVSHAGGVIAPGNSAGKLNVTGNYTQTTSSRLQIEIGGVTPATQHDILDITGSAALGGNLELFVINGFAPLPSDTFTILEASTITGAFSNVANGQRRATGDGLGSFLVHYGPASAFNPLQVVLSAFQASLAGDFDGDGDVDGGDFLVWQRGGSPNPMSSTDLTDWKNNYGAPPLVAASLGVPEPSTWVLLSLMA
ncbi:MAG: hypothetical protein H0T51_11480, partial [Pirellulales bacterium]|nr:hypothetical protein [Pirellulales bacterium]